MSESPSPVGSAGSTGFSFPQFERVEHESKVAILINEGTGWIVQTPHGPRINPWTKAPFQSLSHARKMARKFLRVGWWPQPKKAPQEVAA